MAIDAIMTTLLREKGVVAEIDAEASRLRKRLELLLALRRVVELADGGNDEVAPVESSFVFRSEIAVADSLATEADELEAGELEDVDDDGDDQQSEVVNGSKPSKPQTAQIIMKYLGRNGPRTTREIADAIGIDRIKVHDCVRHSKLFERVNDKWTLSGDGHAAFVVLRESELA